MRQTYQTPLRFHLGESSQRELSKPADVFDFGKHRLHRRVSFLVGFKSTWLAQLVPHSFPNACVLWEVNGVPITWRRLVWWNIQIDVLQTFMRHSRSAEVTCISRCLFRHSPNILFYFLQGRNQLLAVICLLNYSCRHDDLRFSINSYLCVVCLLITSR